MGIVCNFMGVIMVSSLQRALVVCQERDYNNEAFLAHLVLARRSSERAHLASCLKLLPKEQDCDALITTIFQFTKLAFEECISIIERTVNVDHKARAYCTLFTHFPERQEECLKGALAAGSKNQKICCKIARTFESVAAVKEILSGVQRGNVLLDISLKGLSRHSSKAKELFLAGIVPLRKEADSETLDLLRSIAIKAMVIKDKERFFYLHNYFHTLRSKEVDTQAKHSKQFFKELIAFNLFQAANAVGSAADFPVICVQGALMVLEAPQKDKPSTEFLGYVQRNIDSLESSRFKAKAAIRRAVIVKSTELPADIQEDFVFRARWIVALLAMRKKKVAVEQLSKFAPSVAAYWNSIREADNEVYIERRKRLLKAASSMHTRFPEISLELVRLALPALANDRLYVQHIKGVATFALNHERIQEGIISLIEARLKSHQQLHDERTDKVGIYSELIKTLYPLSAQLSLKLLAHARTIIKNPKSFAEQLGDEPHFLEVKKELYDEALQQSPNDIELMVAKASLLEGQMKEELLIQALDTWLEGADKSKYLLEKVLGSLITL